VARPGGDEFLVILEELPESPQEAATQAKVVGEKILAALNEPYQLPNHLHVSSPSIGITLYGGQKVEVDELLTQAELAMYQAKASGGNTLRFFDPQMQSTVNIRASLESRLREALSQSQLVLYYQPQVDDQGRITGSEALVRWLDPKRGMVAPGEFIPVAEESGLILPLGQWVLDSA
jgi:predicted signal transduction protein with EAL and GGDEF domain